MKNIRRVLKIFFSLTKDLNFTNDIKLFRKIMINLQTHRAVDHEKVNPKKTHQQLIILKEPRTFLIPV